ncbi:replication protein [Brenneria alni]|uniref:Replication protein n=2 Tax=Brenneria alni TaxID=71656 RepID=A0A421DR72_9GAMM|nr:replication protein [Brenneria alni]RLM26571.1 replication protein [Brenneria alni]
MKNQKSGYIPLYRSIMKKPWAKDVYLRTLWENILMSAARLPYTAQFKGHEWQLQSGQLVTTAADLGLSLCDRKGKATSRDAVERMLAFFVKEGMISIEGEQKKGRVITVLNYAEYAEKIDNSPAQITAHTTAQITAHDEASNGAASGGGAAQIAAHTTAQITAHHEQEGNNKNKRSSSLPNSDEFTNTDETASAPDGFLSRHPDASVYTPNGKSWGTADDLTAVRWMYKKILVVDASAKTPNWAEWANTIRLMREQDNRDHREICELFRWANADPFWGSNILSPKKLRKQWGTLKAQQQSRGGKPQRETLDWDNTDWADGLGGLI